MVNEAALHSIDGRVDSNSYYLLPWTVLRRRRGGTRARCHMALVAQPNGGWVAINTVPKAPPAAMPSPPEPRYYHQFQAQYQHPQQQQQRQHQVQQQVQQQVQHQVQPQTPPQAQLNALPNYVPIFMCKRHEEAQKMQKTAAELCYALSNLNDDDAEMFRKTCVVFVMANDEDAQRLKRLKSRHITGLLEQYIRRTRSVEIMYITTLIYVAAFEHFEGPVKFDFPMRSNRSAPGPFANLRDVLGLSPHFNAVTRETKEWFINLDFVLGHNPKSRYIMLHSRLMWLRGRLPQTSTPQAQQFLRTVLITEPETVTEDDL